MLIFWRIRYFDRDEKEFKDRDLYLDTATLPPAKRAAVELLTESKGSRNERKFLKFKSLFREQRPEDWEECQNYPGPINSFALPDYLEDEDGNEITLGEIGPILSGNPDTVLVPSGARQHDLDYFFAEKQPVPVAEVELSEDESRLFGYFVRDLQELGDSALMKEGPGTISRGGTRPVLANNDYHLETAVTDDEIRSYVTIFRRLYMDREPANLFKAVDLFEKALGGHPLGRWVRGVASEYNAHLQEVPVFCQRRIDMTVTFSAKRLIDAFLYTQYAHQPDERRQRQFNECLQQVGGRRHFLLWQFLTEAWKSGLKIGNAGRVIARWFKAYCDHHGITPDVLDSLRREHTGIGVAEKKEEQKARLFREKVEELEVELWKQAGRPEGGPVQFRTLAQQQLSHALDSEEGTT